MPLGNTRRENALNFMTWLRCKAYGRHERGDIEGAPRKKEVPFLPFPLLCTLRCGRDAERSRQAGGTGAAGCINYGSRAKTKTESGTVAAEKEMKERRRRRRRRRGRKMHKERSGDGEGRNSGNFVARRRQCRDRDGGIGIS